MNTKNLIRSSFAAPASFRALRAALLLLLASLLVALPMPARADWWGSSSGTQAEAYRLAGNAGAQMVSDRYDGGKNVTTYVSSWRYVPSDQEYVAEVTVKWDGNNFLTNHYWAKGTLRMAADGTTYRFNATDISDSLSTYLGWKLGVALGNALSEDANRNK